jgi:hypothetical protein
MKFIQNFVALGIRMREEDDIERLRDINRRVDNLNARLPYRIRVVIVDAQKSPPSASHLPNDLFSDRL